MQRILFLMFIAFFAIQNVTYAQDIRGLVKDSSSIPISYATVVLCNMTDTTQVSYTITDLQGRFSIKPSDSNDYLLHVSFIGYKPQYLPAKPEQIIILEQSAVTLDEVVVKGSLPISKMTSNGIQTTVANTLLSNMGTGNEVLKRIPMVIGDDGSFEVFGRGKATIYINNREVRDPSELDNLNSSDIADIEVISNPGARYNASVKAIINIKTVKKQGDGFSFNARSSFYTWENQDYINQINTNYRKDKLDVFANIHYSNITSTQRGEILQSVKLDTLWQQQNYMNATNQRNKLNGTLGANYQINDNHYIGFRCDIETSPAYNHSHTELTSEVLTNNVFFDQWENNEVKEIKNKVGSQTNLYYAGKVKKLSIDFNADYMNSGSESNNTDTEFSNQYEDRVLFSTSNIDNKLWASKILLSYSIWKGKLSAGSEYVNITRSDAYINSNLIGFSSEVDISEQNLAFFTQYQIQTKIGNLSAGIRYEDAKYDYLVDRIKDNDKSRKYGQWFPSASYSNRFGGISVQLSYNSKVVRPTYTQLSNNLFYSNRFTIQTGNPYLKPTVSHDVSLMGIWKFIQAQINYTHQKDAIVMWIDRYKDDPKISVNNYKNISELPKLSAFVSIAPLFGIYRPQLSSGVQKHWQDYSRYGLDVNLKKPIFFVALDNIFDLPHNFMINLDAIYTSKGYGPIMYSYNHSFKLDFGVSKSFFKEALKAKLTVSDITNQSQAIKTVMPQMELKNLYYFDNREVSLTLRYYFNSAKSKYKGSAAGSDALNRF